MDVIKYFNVGCNDEEWIKNVIIHYNSLHATNFKLEEMLYWETIFAKIATTESVAQIFDFAKFVAHFETIEYIEGRI